MSMGASTSRALSPNRRGFVEAEVEARASVALTTAELYGVQTNTGWSKGNQTI